MARAASAVPHQPDSTNPTHLPVLTSTPPLCLFLLYYLITLCIHLSTAPRLHSLRHPTGRLRPFRRYQHNMTLPPFRHQFAPTLYPMSTKAAPAGRRLTSAQRDSLNWCTPPAQRCSTSLFLHAGASRIARLIVFSIAGFDCLFLFD